MATVGLIGFVFELDFVLLIVVRHTILIVVTHSAELGRTLPEVRLMDDGKLTPAAMA